MLFGIRIGGEKYSTFEHADRHKHANSAAPHNNTMLLLLRIYVLYACEVWLLSVELTLCFLIAMLLQELGNGI